MPGIGLIINPRARGSRGSADVHRLRRQLAGWGFPLVTDSLHDLHRAAEQFRAEGLDCLGILGGDGTLHHTLTAFIQSYGTAPLPAIAILRGGTMNTIANSLQIRGDPEDLLGQLIACQEKEKEKGVPLPTFEHQLLQVGGAYGFIFGTGLVYNFLRAYYDTGHPSPLTAARLLGRTFLSEIGGGPLSRSIAQRFSAQVTVDGQPWARRDFIAVAAGVVEDIGLGFRPFHHCYQRPRHMALVGVHTTALGFAAELPRIRAGAGMRPDRCTEAVAQETLLQGDGRLKYVVDGDLYERPDGRLTLTCGPLLRFVDLARSCPRPRTLTKLVSFSPWSPPSKEHVPPITVLS